MEAFCVVGVIHLVMIFHERVAFAACFSRDVTVLHWVSGGDSWCFAVDMPPVSSLLFGSFPQVPPDLWVTLGGVLWRLGAILWHIHGFCTDTQA